MVNCDAPEDFTKNLVKLVDNLHAKGYRRNILDSCMHAFKYDESKRKLLIEGKADKEDANSPAEKLNFIATFSNDMQKVGIPSILKYHLRRLCYVDIPKLNVDIVMAYRSGVSMFRELYALNKPYGSGRAGFLCDRSHKKSPKL